jgi:hypothetical protein
MNRGPSNGLATNPVVIELVERWEQRGLTWPEFCAAAALYSEMIALREGPDGGVRFLMKQFQMSEVEARDAIHMGEWAVRAARAAGPGPGPGDAS